MSKRIPILLTVLALLLPMLFACGGAPTVTDTTKVESQRHLLFKRRPSLRPQSRAGQSCWIMADLCTPSSDRTSAR